MLMLMPMYTIIIIPLRVNILLWLGCGIPAVYEIRGPVRGLDSRTHDAVYCPLLPPQERSKCQRCRGNHQVRRGFVNGLFLTVVRVRIKGKGYRVQGTGYRVQGTGYRLKGKG